MTMVYILISLKLQLQLKLTHRSPLAGQDIFAN
jgi:hypothetical protein